MSTLNKNKIHIQVNNSLVKNGTNLTSRKKDELQIQNMTQNWPTVDLDNPKNLKNWLNKYK